MDLVSWIARILRRVCEQICENRQRLGLNRGTHLYMIASWSWIWREKMRCARSRRIIFLKSGQKHVCLLHSCAAHPGNVNEKCQWQSLLLQPKVIDIGTTVFDSDHQLRLAGSDAKHQATGAPGVSHADRSFTAAPATKHFLGVAEVNGCQEGSFAYERGSR